MDRSEMVDSTGGDRRVTATNKLRVEVDDPSAYDNSERGENEAQEAAAARVAPPPPPPWSYYGHRPAGGGGAAGVGSNRRRLLSKQLSMKETTREAKWEKRRRQILRRSGGLVPAVRDRDGYDGGNKSAASSEQRHHAVVRSSSERAMRCLTDEDLDELRGSFELGFGFHEETGGAHLRDTLPALDFYFAVSRQLSDPKLRTLTAAASPTSTLSAVSSASTLPDTPSPRSPNDAGDPWKIFSPGENPQLVKTRLRHWAQVVACTIKHGC